MNHRSTRRTPTPPDHILPPIEIVPSVPGAPGPNDKVFQVQWVKPNESGISEPMALGEALAVLVALSAEGSDKPYIMTLKLSRDKAAVVELQIGVQPPNQPLMLRAPDQRFPGHAERCQIWGEPDADAYIIDCDDPRRARIEAILSEEETP